MDALSLLIFLSASKKSIWVKSGSLEGRLTNGSLRAVLSHESAHLPPAVLTEPINGTFQVCNDLLPSRFQDIYLFFWGKILWLQNSNVGDEVLPDSGLGIFLSRYTQFSLFKDEINLCSLKFMKEIINEKFKLTKVTELMSTLSSLCVLRLELPLKVIPPW